MCLVAVLGLQLLGQQGAIAATTQAALRCLQGCE